mmetsp:Transcript_14006/g.30434  ORF Transcript_14006/g.30434 Transcript_14006/m.30434 type:complete len:226 (-) Transcript_14006:540-1217(-)
MPAPALGGPPLTIAKAKATTTARARARDTIRPILTQAILTPLAISMLMTSPTLTAASSTFASLPRARAVAPSDSSKKAMCAFTMKRQPCGTWRDPQERQEGPATQDNEESQERTASQDNQEAPAGQDPKASQDPQGRHPQASAISAANVISLIMSTLIHRGPGCMPSSTPPPPTASCRLSRARKSCLMLTPPLMMIKRRGSEYRGQSMIPIRQSSFVTRPTTVAP